MTEPGQDKKDQAGGNDESRTCSEDGVDLTLIRWMLSMSPAERLITLQNTIRSFERLTDGARKP